MNPAVLMTIDGQVATVTLNRPDRRNAINQQLLAELCDAVDTAARREDIRVMVLTGSDPSFCSGLDLDAIHTENLFNPRGDGRQLPEVIVDCRKPIIGAINGHAITGGFEIALNCDFLIASEHAVFADTHIHMGIHPGWGMSQLLQEAVGMRRALQLSLTGDAIDARTALKWGLVNEVVPHSRLLDRTREIAHRIASADPAMVRTIRSLIHRRRESVHSQAVAAERRGFMRFAAEHLPRID